MVSLRIRLSVLINIFRYIYQIMMLNFGQLLMLAVYPKILACVTKQWQMTKLMSLFWSTSAKYRSPMVAHCATKQNPFAESFSVQVDFYKYLNTPFVFIGLVSDWQFAFVNIAVSEYGFWQTSHLNICMNICLFI